MPKVLFLTDSLLNGGAERQLALLVKSLPHNWESRVWSMEGGPFAEVIRCSGVQLEIHRRSWRWDMTPALSLWRLVKTWRPVVIHSYGYMSSLAVLPAAMFFGIPLVDGTIRQGNIPRYRGRLMKWSLRWADRVIANSQAGLSAFDIDTKRGRVVHNGFDLKRLEQNSSEKRQRAFTVIMVGRMVAEKDYSTFIKAAHLLVDWEGEWRFIAMGAGTLRETFIEQAKDLIQRGCFEFPQPNLEVIPYVTQADIGVLMTSLGNHEEGISNAIIEYMACSLPVVCSESGGNQELVVEGETGFIIESGNAAALAEKLLWLKHNPDIARKMGLAGKKRINREFTVENLVNGTLAVYREILSP